jgi:ribosomal-protein-alanine N-acetyltransferase
MRAIATPRLRLRRLAANDLALIYALYTDARTMRHIGRPFSRALARASLHATLRAMREPEGPRFFVIVERKGSRKLGLCSLKYDREEAAAEIGIMLRAAARGKGLAGEALSALADAAFATLPIDALWVQYRSANKNAARLFVVLGFQEAIRWRPRLARRRLRIAVLRRGAQPTDSIKVRGIQCQIS